MSAAKIMLEHRYGGLFGRRRFRGPLYVNPLANILFPLLMGDKEEALKGAKYHRKGAKRAQWFFMPEPAKKAGTAMEPVFERIEQGIEGDTDETSMNDAVFAGVAEAFGEITGRISVGSVTVSSDRSGADAFIDKANEAIELGMPKLAYQHLYHAEIAHHSSGNQPPPKRQEERLMAAWGAFGHILPDRVRVVDGRVETVNV